MLIYGIHTVASFLELKPHLVKTLYLPKKQLSSRLAELCEIAKKQRISIQNADSQSLSRKLAAVNHQQVMAEIADMQLDEQQLLDDLAHPSRDPSTVLILDGVQDPHNLGACLRNADAFGVAAVVVPRANSCRLTETVHRVASGASASVPLVAVSNLNRFIKQLKQLSYWLYGFSDAAEQSIYETKFASHSALVLGGEGQGIKSLVKKHCDFLLSIPMQGVVSSLNVSAATAVGLFEVARQRGLAN